MIQGFLILFITILIPATGFCGESPVEYSIKLKPSILNQDDGNKYGAGIDFKAFVSYKPYTGEEITYRKALGVEIRSEGMLATDKDLNPRPLRAESVFAGFLNMSGPKIAERGEQEGEEIITQYPFDYGRLSTGLNIGYETDQQFDNRNITAGGEVAYVYVEHANWKALVPSLIAAYEWVSVDKSERSESLGVEDNGFSRFRIAASWKVLVGEYLPDQLKPLTFHVDARYFNERNRPDAIKDLNEDEASYIAGALNYVFDKPVAYDLISGVFLKVSDGRIPPAVKESTLVHLVVIFSNKLLE